MEWPWEWLGRQDYEMIQLTLSRCLILLCLSPLSCQWNQFYLNTLRSASRVARSLFFVSYSAPPPCSDCANLPQRYGMKVVWLPDAYLQHYIGLGNLLDFIVILNKFWMSQILHAFEFLSGTLYCLCICVTRFSLEWEILDSLQSKVN